MITFAGTASDVNNGSVTNYSIEFEPLLENGIPIYTIVYSDHKSLQYPVYVGTGTYSTDNGVTNTPCTCYLFATRDEMNESYRWFISTSQPGSDAFDIDSFGNNIIAFFLSNSSSVLPLESVNSIFREDTTWTNAQLTVANGAYPVYHDHSGYYEITGTRKSDDATMSLRLENAGTMTYGGLTFDTFSGTMYINGVAQGTYTMAPGNCSDHWHRWDIHEGWIIKNASTNAELCLYVFGNIYDETSYVPFYPYFEKQYIQAHETGFVYLDEPDNYDDENSIYTMSITYHENAG